VAGAPGARGQNNAQLHGKPFCPGATPLDEPFILFTVDVVAGLKTIEDFFRKAQALPDATGVLALTEHIDDEKPLWATVDDTNRITAMGEAAKGAVRNCRLLLFHAGYFALVDTARSRKFGALRQFLGLLVEEGHALYACPSPRPSTWTIRKTLQRLKPF